MANDARSKVGTVRMDPFILLQIMTDPQACEFC